MPDFSSHVLVVTGGSRGIGAAIVRQTARAGARVCFSYLRERETAAALCEELSAGGGQVFSVQGDSADATFPAQLLDAAEARFGAVTMLVNNAGITGRYGPFQDLPAETLRQTFEVNVSGPLLLAPIAVDATSVAPRTKPSFYPPVLAARVANRVMFGSDNPLPGPSSARSRSSRRRPS